MIRSRIESCPEGQFEEPVMRAISSILSMTGIVLTSVLVLAQLPAPPPAPSAQNPVPAPTPPPAAPSAVPVPTPQPAPPSGYGGCVTGAHGGVTTPTRGGLAESGRSKRPVRLRRIHPHPSPSPTGRGEDRNMPRIGGVREEPLRPELPSPGILPSKAGGSAGFNWTR